MEMKPDAIKKENPISQKLIKILENERNVINNMILENQDQVTISSLNIG